MKALPYLLMFAAGVLAALATPGPDWLAIIAVSVAFGGGVLSGRSS